MLIENFHYLEAIDLGSTEIKTNIPFVDVKKEKIRTKEIAKCEAFLSVEPKSIASIYRTSCENIITFCDAYFRLNFSLVFVPLLRGR